MNSMGLLAISTVVGVGAGVGGTLLIICGYNKYKHGCFKLSVPTAQVAVNQVQGQGPSEPISSNFKEGLEKLKKEKEELLNRVSDMQKQIDGLRKSGQAMSESNNSEGNLEELQKEKEELKNRVSNMQEQIADLQRLDASYQQRIEELEENLAKSQKEVFTWFEKEENYRTAFAEFIKNCSTTGYRYNIKSNTIVFTGNNKDWVAYKDIVEHVRDENFPVQLANSLKDKFGENYAQFLEELFA